MGPIALAAAVWLLAGAFEFFPEMPFGGLVRRLEWISYDWRVRLAAPHSKPAATNLAAVFIDDRSLRVVNEALHHNWPWPRELHGLLVRRLTEQGAKRIAFDILFAELQPDTGSDVAFAAELGNARNTCLAAFGETLGNQWHAIPPATLFRTNALAIGHAASDRDADGVLRRAKPFKDDPKLGRLWHLGILLAAAELGLDLDRTKVSSQSVILHGSGGTERIIPLDSEGYFHIDWSMNWNDRRMMLREFADVIGRDSDPRNNPPIDTPFKDKLVVVGSIGAGNNISDMGATPLSRETYLISKHWNVANSVITGVFVQRTGKAVGVLLILLLGAFGAWATWRFSAKRAAAVVVATSIAYTAIAAVAYLQWRLWLPLTLPILGGLLLTHVATVTHRLVFEERETRRVRGIFSRLVAPEVVTELLAAKDLHLGGARRRVTVFFADIRGFTEMTDSSQAKAEDFVRQNNLPAEQAESFHAQQAQEMLATVNSYLSAIADQIKKHGGTLDKYIGDCVMAFWGAPALVERHALSCVRAAIDAQRAIHELNQQRFAENKRRETENAARATTSQPPLPLLPLLSLGTGINTGTAVVGLMGSDAHILNYTVFGREVNIAARLENVSGRGRIFIADSTFQEIKRDDPALAATCIAQAPQILKGIHGAVKIFEVPWKPAAASQPAQTSASIGTSPPPPRAAQETAAPTRSG